MVIFVNAEHPWNIPLFAVVVVNVVKLGGKLIVVRAEHELNTFWFIVVKFVANVISTLTNELQFWNAFADIVVQALDVLEPQSKNISVYPLLLITLPEPIVVVDCDTI